MTAHKKVAFGAIIIVFLLGMIGNHPATVSRAQPQSAPILVVVNDQAPQKFGRYLGEILRAEGLNAYDLVTLDALTANDLAAHDVTILAQTPLSDAQATLLQNHVNGGGRLLAMRPDAQIASLFDLGAAQGTLTDGYVRIDPAATLDGSQPGAGLTGETLQIHGVTDQYTPAGGAVTLAQLYANSTQPTAYPAVVSNAAGTAIAYTYDLAANVVYTRQGNPANADVDTDGDTVLRTIDLFQSAGGGMPWVDRTKIPIPQADMQQRHFARLVKQLVAGTRPMPQLWYFPEDKKTVMVLTADAHGNPTSYYQDEINSLNAYGATATFYLALSGEPNDATIQSWRSQGHDFGIHPYWNRPDSYKPYNITNLSEGYQVFTDWFTSNFTSPPSRTVRNHQVAWLGWTGSAGLAASYGYALDTNFYHWGPWLRLPGGEWPHGYITGSGRPMKFITADGTVLPIYQQLTQLVDEQFAGGGSYEGLNAAEAIAVSRQLIDASEAGDYAAIMTQFHVDTWGNGTAKQWAEGTMAYANSLGIPLLNAEEWLTFTEARHDADLTNITWQPGTGQLSFNLETDNSGDELSVLLPLVYDNVNFNAVLVGGAPTSYQTFMVSGVEYALVTVTAGNHTFSASYGAEPNTPTPSPTAPTNTPEPTATNTPTPVDGSVTHTSVVDFAAGCQVEDNSLVSSVGDGAVVLAGQFNDRFTGSGLGGGLWNAGTWSGGAFAPGLADGQMTIGAGSGGWVRSVPVFTHGELEVTAAFGSGAWQHVGFASNEFSGNRYLIFSTLSGDGNLYARVNNNASESRVNLGAIPSGLHRYRISWRALDGTTDIVRFYVDGAQVAELTAGSGGASNYYVYLSNNGNAPLVVDEADVAPAYAASGTYISCVLDAGTDNAWETVAWTAASPTGTALKIQVRTSLDGVTWEPWSAVTEAAGSVIPTLGRYVQYQVGLGTSDVAASPSLEAITLSYMPAAQITPVPTATATNTPEPTATETPGPTATNTVEPTVTNTPEVTPTNTPGPTALPTNTPTALPTNTPTPVDGSVTHTSVADFAAGCQVEDNSLVSSVGDGMVVLAGQFNDRFTGSGLDGELWSAGTWSGGAFAPGLADGQMTIGAGSGGWVRSVPVFTHGELEVTAAFGNGAWQHVGFASNEFSGNRYLIFSTLSGDGNLYARVNNNASESRVNLGAIPSGLHRYRISWRALDGTTDIVRFYVDGAQVAELTAGSGGASNYYVYLSNNGNAPLVVDEADVAPAYAASGAYISCVLDAGTDNAWETVAWSASSPTDTSLTVQTRTSSNGGIWESWATVENETGSLIPAPQRYLQYQLLLSTNDPNVTTQLDEVVLGFEATAGTASSAFDGEDESARDTTDSTSDPTVDPKVEPTEEAPAYLYLPLLER